MRQERSSTVLYVVGALLVLVPFVPAGALSLRSIVVSAGIASIFILIIRRTERVFVSRRIRYALLVVVPLLLAMLVWDVSMPDPARATIKASFSAPRTRSGTAGTFWSTRTRSTEW